MQKAILTGIAASTGIGSGTVVVIDDLIDGIPAPEGVDIVVIGEMIPPEVTLLPANTRALVTDEGGLLCHGATLAREMQIPCVVGTQDATSMLKAGEVVTVDGGKGVVYRG